MAYRRHGGVQEAVVDGRRDGSGGGLLRLELLEEAEPHLADDPHHQAPPRAHRLRAPAAALPLEGALGHRLAEHVPEA